MWLPDVPEPAGALRQGDLLRDVIYHKAATVPLKVARHPNAEPANGDSAFVTVKCGNCLVV